MKQICFIILTLIFLVSCSTTSSLLEDECLYTGIKSINVDDKKDTDAEEIALAEVEGALAYAPNNSLFGSSSLRTPLPIGLWIYNSMEGKELKGVGKWFFNTFSSVPKTISSAAPDMRSKIATNILQNYGYFNGSVDYRLVTNKRNPRKQKIEYNVHLGRPYMFDSIKYAYNGIQDSIIQATQGDALIRCDKQFSVVDLQNEKSRLTTEFHNNGFYYYSPNYIEYFADSINVPDKVKLLVAPTSGIPNKANRQWKFGRVSAFVRNNTMQERRGMAYSDTIVYKRLSIAYQGKTIPVKPRIMFRNFRFWTGQKYNEAKVNQSLTELRNMNIFSNVQFSFTPHDTTDTCTVLDVRLDATMEKKMSFELDFNISQKSNAQVGPDASLTFSKTNAFHNSETLALTLHGSYYWQTKNRSKDKVNNLDTYDWGTDLSLSYPWLLSPGFLRQRFLYPTSTRFSLSFQRTNIAKMMRMKQLSLGVDYKFQTSKYIKHTFTPLHIEVSDCKMDNDSIKLQNISFLLRTLLNDGFVPSIQYSFSYDNSFDESRVVSSNFVATIKESGNLMNGLYALAGKDYNEKGKKFCGLQFFQFVKIDLELRNKFRISPNSCIATRLLFGGVMPFGNASLIPMSELYYSGGANSVRAFPARSLGPSNTPYSRDDSYFIHSGKMRIEANAEYRFPIFGNLKGALFVDTGNVFGGFFEEELIDTELNANNFFNQLALGTGFGFRYDLQFLVLRLDFGVAIHAPYDTGKKGYYNINRFFKDGTTINFAVGYPF